MSAEGTEPEAQPHGRVALDLGGKEPEISGLTRRRLAAGAVLGAGIAISLAVLGRQLGVDVAPIGVATAGLSSMGAVVLPEALYPRRRMRTRTSQPARLQAPAEAGVPAPLAKAGKTRAGVAVATPEAKTANEPLHV